ncbi:MAG: PKD domain-containing protein [Candidatus Eisenbacteria bacterium]|nr:PKD domain-containing protein [Candidatus Latescibacterota bacterium]MBD3303219.1 PKD domain-containing protein [Candidatus Eisenbacteria bacterium]
MSKPVFIAFISLMVAGGSAIAADPIPSAGRIPADQLPNEIGIVSDEFIVVFQDAVLAPAETSFDRGERTGLPELDLLATRNGVRELRPQFPGAQERGIDQLAAHYKVRTDGATPIETVMAAFADAGAIASVEPIGIHPTSAIPNDTFFADQWHLDQTSDHDVDAPEAWDVETGDPAIIVAILDTGVRYYHKDLGGVNASSSNPEAARGNNWINQAELNGASGVDDDGNGYVDDWIGYDFVDGVSSCWTGEDCNNQDNDPRDFNGHGTHCAGNVGAMNNNGYATAAPSGGYGSGALEEFGNGVRVMACRVGWSGSYFGQEAGYVRMDFCAEAFYYAADNGARIASCSWGSSNSGGIDAAVSYFTGIGGLVFKAAGNSNNQTADFLCGRSDVISVASTDQNDCKSSFSSYGTWVDISAPGTDIVSLYHVHDDPSGDYVATVSGTSMATPLAASVAALIWSQNPGWSASQVAQQLYATADPIDDLGCNGSYIGKLGAGRVNAYEAVNTGTPPPVADFTGTPTSGCAPLTVTFTDQSTGEIASWDWDFGDGGTSTAQNPTHDYTAPGDYTVTLTVTGPGGSDTEPKIDYISVGTVPVADFTGTPLSGTAPLTVQFTDATTGNPTSWDWDFGDGGTETDANPSHTYASEGDYTVTLTASNACGSDDEVKLGYVHVDPASPVALAQNDIPVYGTVTGDYTDTHGSDDVYEVITEVSSQDHPRKWHSRLEHRWEFNVAGGTVVTFSVEAFRPDNSDNDDFSFEYSTDGTAFSPILVVDSATEQTYVASLPSDLSGVVTVRVVDTDRNRDNQSLDSIHVDAMSIESSSDPLPPVADFVGDPTSGYAPLTVQFTDLSLNAPTSWSWDFGDQGTSTVQNPSHEYASPGLYTVTLTATNAYGSDAETKIDYIVVEEQGSAVMHVHDMVVDRKIAGPNHSGQCTVTIFDATEAPVSGATVFVTATGPVGDNFSGVTATDGTVFFETGKTKNPVGEWCFEVTDVTHPTFTYEPAANHVTMACESGIVYGDRTLRIQEEGPSALALSAGVLRGDGTIAYRLAAAGSIELDLYDVTGARVDRVDRGWRNAGIHTARIDQGRLPAGVYFLRLAAPDRTAVERLLILR